MAIGQQLRNAIGTVYRGMIGAVSRGLSALSAVPSEIGQALRSGTGETIVDAATLEQAATFATGQEAAKQAFGAAAPDQGIDASMITFAPWSMDLQAYNTTPAHDLYIGFNVPGVPETVYRVLANVDQLGATKQDVSDLALANAPALLAPEGLSGADGDVANATIDSITILVSRPVA